MKRRQHSCTVFVGDQEYIAYYDYSRGRPGRMYLDNGDPGYPPDPPELCVNRIVLGNLTIQSEDMGGPMYEDIGQQCMDYQMEKEESDMIDYYESRHCE